MVVSQSLIPDLVPADQEQVGQTLKIREGIKWFEGEHSEKQKNALNNYISSLSACLVMKGGGLYEFSNFGTFHSFHLKILINCQ